MQRIVYGYTPRFEYLAFVDGRVAEAMADEMAAILTASTFRAAAEVRTEHVHNPLAESLREDGEDARYWDEPFDPPQLD